MNTMDRIAMAVRTQFNYPEPAARRIAQTLVRHGVVVIDKHTGGWSLVHGTYWSADVMANALDASR